MIDFNNTDNLVQRIDAANAERDTARIERDEARARIAAHAAEVQSAQAAYRLLKSSLQSDLAEWAESYIQPGDEDYKELSELMVNNGLEGLKRSFIVGVRVTYEFEVEVEAADEDEAQDEVDNNITTYAHEHVSLYDSPDDTDFEVNEA
jgi:hypothetical protein